MRNPETRLVLVIDGQGGGIGSQLVKLCLLYTSRCV